ncbi:hypothetical protein Tco_1108393 [Tanacetum coccineum]
MVTTVRSLCLGHEAVIVVQGSGWNNLAHSNVTGGATIPLVHNTTHGPSAATGIFRIGAARFVYPSVGPPGFIQRQAQPTSTIGQTVHTESMGLTIIQDMRPPCLMLLLPGSFMIWLLAARIWIQRVPYDQRNNPLQHPRVVYPPILNINYFCHFLDILRNYDPIDDEPMWAADRVVASTPGSVITIPKTTNEFAIKGNHLTLVKGNQFDGRTKADPHKHIHECLRICDMFKYRDTENESVRIMMFPLSLTREAKTWLDELNEGTIETWDKL